ncbi:uncharacterized protein TEOVI_000552100 [Trypanosoma equiperdum]|uniref:Uncharacterized protein n=1 Tax=Trypanosoma equiperdum TaxID=5694 RepID=A0A1G4I8E6_TRYEQ|nr:hypothetical protein, conserved [Trypanosoma equiperdum]
MSPRTSERILALGVRRLRIRSSSTASSSCNGVVEFSTCGGAGGPSYRPLAAMAMIANIQAVAFTNSRRSVFQNKKTLPSPHGRNITPDAAETKGRALFSDSNSECFPADLDPPSASQLDRILPSLNQLRDEIPSSEYVEELVRRQGVSTDLWSNGERNNSADDDDE